MHSNSGTTKYLSFKGSQDYDGPPKVGFESLASPGQVITVSTVEGSNSNRVPYSSSVLQTNIGCKQAGNGYTVTTYTPNQFDAHSIGHAHEKRISSTSSTTSQDTSVTMGTPFPHRSALSHQYLGNGVAAITSVPAAPANRGFVGTTALRTASKPVAAPAQLTIFYAGSVCVYDDVSPEKAQAIMLLAGNGKTSTNTPSKAPTLTTAITARVETPIQSPLYGANSFISNKLPIIQTTPVCLSSIPSPIPISVSIPRPTSCGGDGLSAIPSPIPISVSIPRPSSRGSDSFVGHEPRKITPSSCTNFPSPISVSSLSSGGSGDVHAARSLASIASPISKSEPYRVVGLQGAHVSTTTTTTPTTLPSAVPQARKASLARFMEKRKERAATIAPYPNPGKESPECVTPRSESRSLSVASAGSFSLSSVKYK